MGQEEVSVIIKSFEDNGNLFSNENREKDIQISRKELVMKTNGKKRMFALLMCVMMIVSSMSVWAAYSSKTIGGATPNDQALCELYCTTNAAEAHTTAGSSLYSVTTAVAVRNANKQTASGEGGSSAYASLSNIIIATSTHQAGPYYTSITI